MRPCLSLSLAIGDLSSLLLLAKYLYTKRSEQLLEVQNEITKLKEVGIVVPMTRTEFHWNSESPGPDIALSNGNLTVTRTDSSGWGCQASAETITSGVHFIEFFIKRNDSSCLLVGLIGEHFSAWGSKMSGEHAYALQADGDFYFNDNRVNNIFSYTTGDRVQVLLDIDNKTVQWYKNGRKEGRLYEGLPQSLRIAACFGGSG